MRAVWIVSWLLLHAAACGGKTEPERDAGGDADTDADTDTDTDTDGPQVVSITPDEGNVAFPDVRIVVTFSELMDAASVEEAVLSSDGDGTAVPMDLGEDDGEAFTFVPGSPLAEDADHTVRVAETATSTDGRPLASGASSTFHVGHCEEWTIAMPEGPALANDGIVVGLSLTTHGCTDTHRYYTTPFLDDVELEAWFLLIGGELYDEPVRQAEARAGANLYVNLFCVEDIDLLTGERELRVEITRWVPGSAPDPLVGEAASTLDLAEVE